MTTSWSGTFPSRATEVAAGWDCVTEKEGKGESSATPALALLHAFGDAEAAVLAACLPTSAVATRDVGNSVGTAREGSGASLDTGAALFPPREPAGSLNSRGASVLLSSAGFAPDVASAVDT